jgi:flagellar export protein FliJ
MRRDRLDALMRVRDIQERRARGDLAMAHRRHRDAVEAEASTWRDLDTRTRRLSEATGADRFRGTRAVTEAGVLAARLQQEVALDAARQVARSEADWTTAARRVEALERLGSRLAEWEQAESDRRAAADVDDLVMARSVRVLRSGS